MSKQRVLIVGGGFAGVKAVLELASDDRFAVTLVSDHPNFRYYPTLYRTATSGRRAGSSIPLERLFAGKGITFIQGEATALSRETKTITLDDGQTIQYDSVILALGVVTNYFNIKGLDKYAFSIKTNNEALRLKEHLHQQLIADHAPDLNYVVVGAGPTGIELAGALPDYLRHIMESHGIAHRQIHVDLIEAAPRLLPNMPKDTSRMVRRRLRKLGVNLYVGQAVQGETADELTVSGRPIRSHTVIWTAGVTNNPFFARNNFALTRRGKVAVDMYLQAEPDIYVIGDNANTPYSGMAQTALHDGAYVADALKRRASGKEPRSYVVKRPISIIPAGEHWAAVLWGKMRLYGWLGYFLREAADLIGFHDLEPWAKASQQWFSEFTTEETCPVCLRTAVQ